MLYGEKKLSEMDQLLQKKRKLWKKIRNIIYYILASSSADQCYVVTTQIRYGPLSIYF